MQAYSNPKRESDPYALPDVEVFWHDKGDYPDSEVWQDSDGEERESGWFYWFCFPGCMPDSGPIGPFATEAEALADAREGVDDE